MSTNTLSTRSTGETITSDFFNDFNTALNSDFVGRNSSGVPTAGQNLGTVAIPWGTVRSSSVVVNGTTLDATLAGTPQNIVKSGKVRSTSNQPAVVVPSGSGATATIVATSTPLVMDINGTAVTASTDIALSGLTLGPSASHTCLVNISGLAGGNASRLYGEEEGLFDYITVDTMGATMSARVGQFCSFKIAGAATEYFFGYLESTTKIRNIKRGFFYNSSSVPINRTTISDNDVITLLSTGWVFVQSNGTTADVSYTTPVWGAVAPSSPATGDYWYDTANQLWKRYDGASFQTINRTLVGMLILDSTNCVGGRTVGFYKNFSDENGIKDLVCDSTSIVNCKNQDVVVSVMGTRFYYKADTPTWNITTDLATSADLYDATEQASRTYWLYITDTGAFKISDITPYTQCEQRGRYHPHNPWLAVGQVYNDGSSNFVAPGAVYIAGEFKVFCSYVASTTSVSTGVATTLTYPTKIKDSHGAYNTSTGIFTAPRKGNYLFSIRHATTSISAAAATNERKLIIYVNAVSKKQFIDLFYITNATTKNIAGATVIPLNQGDGVYVQLDQSSGATWVGNGESDTQEFTVAEI